jgi:hypothetical protein
MGASVDWYDATRTGTAARGGVTGRVTGDSATMEKNGQTVTLDVPAKIINGRTMVPARAIAESFGAQVGWNQAGQFVTITL